MLEGEGWRAGVARPTPFGVEFNSEAAKAAAPNISHDLLLYIFLTNEKGLSQLKGQPWCSGCRWRWLLPNLLRLT